MTRPIRTSQFRPDVYFPRPFFDRITEIRVRQPEVVMEESAARRGPQSLTRDGRLVLLAADHPARMALRAGTDPMAMGNRWTLLGRVLRVLTAPECDGVMATPDVIEELLIINRVVAEAGGQRFLDGKVLIGCMNRGGLAGSAFELDDRMTAFTPDRIAALRLDGAKMMFRLEPRDPSSLSTIVACAEAVTACQSLGLPVFLEAMMVKSTPRGIEVVKTAEALIQAISVASALGASSVRTWLKVPYVDGFDRVVVATTLPILILGGESRGDPGPLLNEIEAAMQSGPTVRGALVGRGVTFPGPEDPRAVTAAAGTIVHQGASVKAALAHGHEARGVEFDRFNRLIPRNGRPQ
jgi:DhnA family fructose-bisphosphate aldolase class Ia